MSGPLRLRPGTAILRMEDGSLQLRAGDETVHLLRSDQPELAERVLQRLAEGALTETALAREIGDAAFVRALLATVGEWLIPQGGAPDAFDYLAHFPGASLQDARIVVSGHAPSTELVRASAAEHEIASSADLDEVRAGDLIVCVIEQPDLSLQLGVNARAIEAGVACLFVDLSHGHHATLGPTYVPGASACIACFRVRLHENSESPAELAAAERHMNERRAPLPAFGLLPAHRQWVLGMAFTEVVAFHTRHRPLRTLGRAITVSFEETRSWSEPVWRVPRCPACDRRGR